MTVARAMGPSCIREFTPAFDFAQYNPVWVLIEEFLCRGPTSLVVLIGSKGRANTLDRYDGRQFRSRRAIPARLVSWPLRAVT